MTIRNILTNLRHLSIPSCLLLSAISGVVLSFAFAPFYIWPIAVLAPVVLFLLTGDGQSNRRLFFIGLCFGLGYFGFGLYWIYNSLHDFGQAPPAVAGFFTALLVVCLALYIPLILFVWKRCEIKYGHRAIWLLPLLWFSVEWIKGWLFTGMPWLSLGYSQTNSPLSGYSPLIGVYGLSAICILLSVILFDAIKHGHPRYLALLVIIPAGGYLLQQVSWTDATSNALKVTMVQGNIPQEVKWQYSQRHNIFNTYWRETSQHWDSDLIVWPETALPGRSEDIQQSILQPMSQAAKENQSNILTGLVVTETVNEIYYNSMLLMGQNEGVYHKRHLVVFGEYFPMRWLLDPLRNVINIPFSDMAAGADEQALMSVKNIVLGLSICFEDVFSRDILLALPEANILVNASNDAWFGDSSAPHQHLQIAQMRAMEFGRPMVRSTNTGVSAFIDDKGRIEKQIGQFKTQSITHNIVARTGSTPFFFFAQVQGFIAILILSCCFLLTIRLRH